MEAAVINLESVKFKCVTLLMIKEKKNKDMQNLLFASIM